MKLSMKYPTSKPVFNMKSMSIIQHISGIKPLTSISLFNYHEACHHPLCTLVHKLETIFLLGVSLGPVILATFREQAKKQSCLSSPRGCYNSGIGSTPNTSNAQHGMDVRTVLLSGLVWQARGWLLAVENVAVRFLFSAHHLVLIMLFHVTSY